MAKLSIREAAKHYQVSRPTLTKALKSGKISGHQDEQGKWSIDPSELARVYHPRTGGIDASQAATMDQPADKISSHDSFRMNDIEALKIQLSEFEIRAVRAETRAEAAELLAEERAERIEDLRRMLPSPSHPKKRWWWPRS